MSKDKENFTLEEVEDIVDKMARTLASLYHFMAKEVYEEYGEDSKKVIERAIYKYGEDRGQKIQQRVLADGKPLTVANLGKYYDLPLHLTWRSKKEKVEENYLEKRVHHCPFAKQWEELGGEELGKIYCIQDLSLRKGFNPDFDFQQFSNVLDKDKDCHTILKLDQEK